MAYTTQVVPVSYKQTDRRWANKPYRNKGENSTIGGSGCGPTCAAMLVATFVDKRETPVDACNWAKNHGYKATGSGTYYTFFKAYFAAHRMDCKQVNSSSVYHKRNTAADKAAKAALKKGQYVIACMGPGDWTRGGHFILLRKLKNGVLYIHDPASSAKSRNKTTWNKLQYQVKYYWVVEPGKIAYFKKANKPIRYYHKKSSKIVDRSKKNEKVYINKKVGSWNQIGYHRWVHNVRLKKSA